MRRYNIRYFNVKIKEWLSDQNFSFILKGSAYSVISKVVVTFSSVIINYVIAQFYGAEAVGRYALIQSFLAVSCIFSEAGLSTSLVRLIPEYSAKFSKTVAFQIYKKSHYLLLFFSIILTGLMFSFVDSIRSLFFTSTDQISLVLYFAIGVILFRTLRNVNIETFRALGNIKSYSLFKAIPNLFELVLLLILTASFAYSENIPIYAHLLSIIVTGILFLILSFSSFPKEKERKKTQSISYKSIFDVSVPLFLVTTMNVVIAQTDVLMIGIFMTESAVGIYHIVYKIGILTIFILSAISSIAAPKFSELYHQGNIQELETSAVRTTRLIFICTFPILLGLIVFGKLILGLFGSEFMIGYIPLLILLIGQFINSLTGPVGYLLSMTQYQNMVRNTTIFAGFSNIILNLLLIPFWGITGAAIATGSSLAIKNLINFYQVKKNLRINLWKLPN